VEVAAKSIGKNLVVVSIAAWLGMYAVAVAIRRMDHKRCEGMECGLPSLPEAESKEGICSQAGTPVYVDYCGEGPTVFMVHGLACNNNIWRYQKAYLSKNYRVVTMDLRGHGRSGVPESMDYDTSCLVEDLEAAVEAFDPDEFVIVGHSMGGFTTFKWYERFGERYRGRLKGLVFVDSSGVDVLDGMVMGGLVRRLYPFPLAGVLNFWKKENRLAQKLMDIYGETALGYLFARYLTFGERPPANEVEFQRELIFATRLPSFAMATKACLDYHMDKDSLAGMDIPVLILAGSKDRLTMQGLSERTCEMLPQASLKVYEGCGHDSMLQCPEKVNRDIEDFLKERFA
jgi:pimeloyl-ACP methyl ester carboxylesterase